MMSIWCLHIFPSLSAAADTNGCYLCLAGSVGIYAAASHVDKWVPLFLQHEYFVLGLATVPLNSHVIDYEICGMKCTLLS